MKRILSRIRDFRFFFSRRCKLLCCALLLPFLLAPSARAIEPSTIIAALPEASALAQQWSPHAFSGLTSFAVGLADLGKDSFNVLLLPWGLLQCSLGGPFGFFDSGLRNMAVGGLAPLRMCWHAVMLPVRLLSLGTIR